MQRTTAVLVSALFVLATVTASPAAAQDSSLWDDFSADEGTDLSLSERIDITNAEIAASLDKIGFQIEAGREDTTDEERATQNANDFAAEFDDQNSTLEEYANDNFDGNASEYDVIALEFQVGEETETRYIVADANNSTFSNSTVVNSTDRTADWTLTLEEYAAANADEELEYFADEYAAENRSIDKPLLTRMGKRYGTHVDLPEEVDWP
ncbi:MAG: hypothetical protein ACOCQY_05070 [Halorhabdus sp.]